MLWICVALLCPILHGWANILDNYFTNARFPNTWTLVFYSTCFSVLFLPLIFLVEMPQPPAVRLLPYFLLSGFIEVIYLYPYYKALQHDDTSVICALFSLGSLFVPVFAFVFVGEILRPVQYIGFIIIVLASTGTSLKNNCGLRSHKSIGYMLICTILLSGQAVIYKYLLQNVTWGTAVLWTVLCTVPWVACMFLLPTLRRDITKHAKQLYRDVALFALNQLLTFIGTAAGLYAISLIPLTLEKGISAFQPFFALLYAVALARFFPRIFRERLDWPNIVKKCCLFVVMVGAVILIA